MCRQLGLSRSNAKARSGALYGQVNGTVLAASIKCQGTEFRLSYCFHNDWRIENCGHNQYVGVSCGKSFKLFPLVAVCLFIGIVKFEHDQINTLVLMFMCIYSMIYDL